MLFVQIEHDIYTMPLLPFRLKMSCYTNPMPLFLILTVSISYFLIYGNDEKMKHVS